MSRQFQPRQTRQPQPQHAEHRKGMSIWQLTNEAANLSVSKFIINKFHLSMNKQPLLHVSAVIYSLFQEAPVYTEWHKALAQLCQTVNNTALQGRIKLFGAPRQWKHFRSLFQAVFLSGRGSGINPPPRQSNTTPPSPKTEITNILFYILNFASIIKSKM